MVQLVVEPSGAVGLAAVLSKDWITFGDSFGRASARHGGKKLPNVGIILSGGNVDLDAMGLWSKFLL